MTSYARLLVELTRAAADRCEAALEPPHWDSTGKREGVYCLRCAKKLFRRRIDGGWIGEEDSPPSCNRCGKYLDFTFSDHGVEEQLGIVEEQGIQTDHDAYCVHRMMNAGGHPLLTESCGDWDYKPEWKPRIRTIYETAIARYVWALHGRFCWDEPHPHRPPFDREAWDRWFEQLAAESTGYWHGRTGRLVERLGISDEEWRRVVAVQNGGVAARSLGDSSHECCVLIASSAQWD